MAIKSFNVDNELHKKYARHCKDKGISMSKQIENFIRVELEKMTSGVKGIEIDDKKIKSELVSNLSAEHSFKKYC